jgi:hypothetical protein
VIRTESAVSPGVSGRAAPRAADALAAKAKKVRRSMVKGSCSYGDVKSMEFMDAVVEG